VLKVSDGKGGARTSAIAIADDFGEADGSHFLTYWQAQDLAKKASTATSNGVTPA
jgi:hypothetical protein